MPLTHAFSYTRMEVTLMKCRSYARCLALVAVPLALSMLVGCAKTRKPGGHMDTPETHYKQGMKYWDADEIDKAEEEFKLAISLDDKFAPGYAGLALTTAKKAQGAEDTNAEEEGFEEAHDLADKAEKLDDDIPEVYIAKALVITMEKEGKEPPKKWLDDVEDEYEKAIDVDPENAEAYYRRGYCYKKAYEFSKAADDFRKVLDLNKGYTAEANKQWELVQKIERAAPGTDVGRRIALVEKISRADIAALFVSEMKIDQLVKKKRPKVYDTGFQAPEDKREMQVDSVVAKKDVTDIEGHWAKNFIMDIVELDIRGLEPYPDHTFHPQELVNRGEYAMMVEDVIIAILGDESLATKHIGSESRFPDVNPSHPAYNAICNAVDKNVMDAEMNGEFKPDASVSGPDALLVIRNLKELNKIP
ncbi:MAG: tetratricopeptide repeat protein [Chitinivibrionales bacterium]|nr:tetratricopeptide repeat protein [Chitinivibrionales bacterium]MBD3396639.1 tetratricopeptide repeat protein [Chitinivibrionales bacterium]